MPSEARLKKFWALIVDNAVNDHDFQLIYASKPQKIGKNRKICWKIGKNRKIGILLKK